MYGTDRRVFPLLRLPKDARNTVLRTMEMLVLLTFSLCSKATKDQIATFIKSLNRECVNFSLKFTSRYSLDISYDDQSIDLNFAKHQPQNQDQATPQPMDLDFIEACLTDYDSDSEPEKCVWIKPDFTVRDWFDHFLSVFGHSKINKAMFFEPGFDIESIRSVLKWIKIRDIVVGPTIPNAYSRLVLNRFLSATHVSLCQNPFEGVTETRGFLMQNLESISLHDQFPVTFNDLIVTNSRSFAFSRSNLTEKDINRFLKLWQSGSNAYMWNFFASFYDRVDMGDKTVILSGLNAKCFTDSDFIERADIHRRSDGTRATIHFYHTFGFALDFYVWPRGD